MLETVKEIAKEMLTTYWSQTVLIFGFVAYFGKRFFDLKSKKREINHSLFQKQKLEAVNNFLLKYSEAELMWNHLAIYRILSEKVHVDELDNTIFPKLNDLRRSELELKIYFTPEQHKIYAEITKEMMSVNSVLKKLYFDIMEEKGVTAKANEYNFALTDVINRNKVRLDQITTDLHKSFTK